MATVEQRIQVDCESEQEALDALAYFETAQLPEGQALASADREGLTVIAIIEFLGWTPPEV